MKTLFKLLVFVGLLSLGFLELPTLIKVVRKAQMSLVIESRSTTWGKPWMPD